MSRRASGNTQVGGGTGPGGAVATSSASRERPNGAATRTRDGSPSSLDSTNSKESGASSAGTTTSNTHFITIRSRVGKRYQAVLPELGEKPRLDDSERASKMLKVMHLSKPRYSVDRANALGNDLEKYLKMARALRDGSTFDTDEQITCLALQYLHRFDYNTTDAACSLYAHHSIEVPKPATYAESTTSTRSQSPAELESRWLVAFYRLMRAPRLDMDKYHEMNELLMKATSSGIAVTELGVLERLVNRLNHWLAAQDSVRDTMVDRVELERLLHQAEDLAFDVPEKASIEQRLRDFDSAYGRLKDALERSNRRNQAKCLLEEIEELYSAVTVQNVSFPESNEFSKVLTEARELRSTITTMLVEEKVSLNAMREMIARIELVPVNFEKEVELFQQKMLNAQSWLAKVRKCIPKRRTSRRGASEPKKMDLQAIRALVDDAPCDDSAEMFEMQDLLECADEWADKVKRAIEGGADVSLESLKELLEEGNAMPVDMDEQKYLEAEIAAREWCTRAADMLAAKKPFSELEEIVEEAKSIRKHLHSKKQSRWKPQIERDIQSALDTARRWINEIRDAIGSASFDKYFASTGSSHSGISSADSSTGDNSKKESRSEATAVFLKGKKSVDVIHKLLEKADKLVVNVEAYTSRLNDILTLTFQSQREAADVLKTIGITQIGSEAGAASSEDIEMTDSQSEKKSLTGDFSHATSVLDKIAALPLVFEEGIKLFEVIHAEKDWTQRVRDAIPPRQSRKKRMSKQSTTLDDLRRLMNESRNLRFQFPDEVKILSKELEDITLWQQKAVEVVANGAVEIVGTVANQLKNHDMEVFNRITKAKKKLTGNGELGSVNSNVHIPENGTEASMIPDKAGAMNLLSNDVQREAKGPPVAPDSSSSIEGTTPSTSELARSTSPGVEPSSPQIPFVSESFKVDEVIEKIRREAGCAKKTNDEGTHDDQNDEQAQKSNSRGISVLDPLMALVEESLAAVNAVETKDDKTRRLDDLVSAVTSPDQPSGQVSPDEAVKHLDSWREQISQVLEEGAMFNAVAPEQHALAVVVELLEWLQSARSIFYNESLPLQDLVEKGKDLEGRLKRIREDRATFDDETVSLLEALFWPLPYLKEHERIVQSWGTRVAKMMEDKHAPIEELQYLLGEAYALQLEPEAFKMILDELKKAKLWLAKLKKRLKTLLSKQANRLTLNVAKSLVEEGDEIAIELPAFDSLKEHVDLAVDWEKRVLASGLDTGHARIAHLLDLLEEYDRARLVIDMDMHRDVLKSATERYCVCRQPYDGFMIGCDHCDDWFHDNCIGMSKEKAEKVENYTCPSCSILQELKSTLDRAVEGHERLWTDTDYGKNYERQHAATLRKIKREEKAIERSEMLIFSCNNHMNQLRARIDDIERAKSCFSTLKSPFDPSLASTSASTAPTPTNGAAAVPSGSGSSTSPVSSSTQTKPSSSLAVTLPLNPKSSSTFTSTPSIPNVPMDTLAFVQRYPNILLPSAKFGIIQTDNAPPKSVGNSLPSTAPTTPATASAQVKNDASTLAQVTSTSQASTTTQSSAASSSTTPVIPDIMPNMLAPMLAKLSENTERLSALLVAGGVEQQLAKMKAEHTEVKSQVAELQEMIRVSKDRLATAQASLDELKRAYVIRQHGLPRAKAWIVRVVGLINNLDNLTRAKFLSHVGARELDFLSPEFDEALIDARAMEIDHFPEVKVYAHLLRAVGWSLATLSMLQERPSREALMAAIIYANEHNLFDPVKAVSPLRSIIGRVDVWVSKAQKCLGKQSAAALKVSRLKMLMNEYSKLPLTCGWVQTIEEYIKSVETEPPANDFYGAAQLVRTQSTLEAAAFAAASAACTMWLPPPTQKPMRKRKIYTKKPKEGENGSATGGKAKKTKTGKGQGSTVEHGDGKSKDTREDDPQPERESEPPTPTTENADVRMAEVVEESESKESS